MTLRSILAVTDFSSKGCHAIARAALLCAEHRATFDAVHAPRAGARFTPGKLTGAAGAGFPRFPSVNANNSHPDSHG